MSLKMKTPIEGKDDDTDKPIDTLDTEDTLI